MWYWWCWPRNGGKGKEHIETFQSNNFRSFLMRCKKNAWRILPLHCLWRFLPGIWRDSLPQHFWRRVWGWVLTERKWQTCFNALLAIAASDMIACFASVLDWICPFSLTTCVKQNQLQVHCFHYYSLGKSQNLVGEMKGEITGSAEPAVLVFSIFSIAQAPEDFLEKQWVCAPGIMRCESMAFQTYGVSSLMEVWCIPKMPGVVCKRCNWSSLVTARLVTKPPSRRPTPEHEASFVRQSTTWHHWAGSNQNSIYIYYIYIYMYIYIYLFM